MIWAGREVNCGEELGATWRRREAERTSVNEKEDEKEHIRVWFEDKTWHGKMEKAVSWADGGFDT